MADRESVIRDLRYVKTFGRVTNTPHLTEIAESALELLREQEQIITSLKADLQETLKVVSEQSNVIRCKDCKHWKRNTEVKNFGYCYLSSKVRGEEWFCANGELTDT